MKKGIIKITVLSLWLAFAATAIYFWARSGLSLSDVPKLLHERLKDFGLMKAAIIYIALYSLRPLIFFPSTVLTVASGVIFGPWTGLLLTIIGANLSANLAFIASRYLGRNLVKKHEHGFVKKWDNKLRENGIMTTMVMSLLYLPFDPVHYGCGLSSMRQRDFAIGTFIGTIPGSITFVMLGGTASAGAAKDIFILGFDISTRVLSITLSALFFVFGFVIVWMLKKHSSTAKKMV